MLVNQLTAKVAQSNKPDIDLLAFTLVQHLENSNALHAVRLIDLVHLSMLTGYFYRVFREKNKVEFIDDPKQDVPSQDAN